MLSLAELERAVAVARDLLVGHRLQELIQPEADRVATVTWGHEGGEGRRRVWLWVASPETARLSLLDRPPRALPRPPAFAQYLRAHVVGARVTDFALRGGDRVAALRLEGAEGESTLLLQILGRRSNLYLLDAEERLRATLRPLDATRPELALGEPWRLPGSGAPRRGEDRFADVPDAELLAAIEAHYAEREQRETEEGLARRVEQSLRKEERRLRRKLEKLEEELAQAEAATRLAREGELLKGALGRIRRGDDAVEVDDPESGETVRIALDPAKTPSQNLEALFKRYQKAVRRLTKGGAQDDAVREASRAHAALLADFAALGEDPEALAAFARRSEVDALLRRHAPAAPGPAPARRAAAGADLLLAGRSVPRRLAPRRYRTAGELEVWVGRSDAANDFLTTRLARGRDLFFHLDGAPGSHVILRTGGRDDPPSEAVLDACELAVHFSKAKKAGRADVHVVPIKNVKKPRGAKPGLVTVHGGKTVHLRRDEARLARVLGARIEE